MKHLDVAAFSLDGFDFFVKKEDDFKLLNDKTFKKAYENLYESYKTAANLNEINLNKAEKSIHKIECKRLLKLVLSGNKARKLAFFSKNNFKPKTRFISYGSAQSNALAALAVMTYVKGFELVYACEKIPEFLKKNPNANFALALRFKAKIIEKLDFNLNLKEFALSLSKKDDIFINQGVADFKAKFGYKELANEILRLEKALSLNKKDFKGLNLRALKRALKSTINRKLNSIKNLEFKKILKDKKKLKDLKSTFKFDIFLSSGTGTSALFLAKNLPNHQIYTTYCVGDKKYLKKQILELEPNFNFENLHILSTKEKFHFAKPKKALLEIYQRALKAGLEFDLLYDSIGLLCVLEHRKSFKKPLLFIHQGGLLGNLSQLQRYEYKFL